MGPSARGMEPPCVGGGSAYRVVIMRECGNSSGQLSAERTCRWLVASIKVYEGGKMALQFVGEELFNS